MSQTFRLRIDGMTCGGCVASVERALSSVAGVQSARVNLATGIAAVDVQGPDVPRNELFAAVRAAGYEPDTVRADETHAPGWQRTQDVRVREHRQAVAQAIGLSIPIMAVHLIAPMVQGGGHGAHVWPQALQGLLTLVLLWSSAGAPILVSGWRAIFRGAPNMDALVSLGVSAATLAGWYSVVSGTHDQGNFHAAAMILAFINMGKYLEARARRETTSAVGALARRMPQTAQVVTPEGVREQPVEQVNIGDRVRIAPDQVVPVDGRIVEGEAALDESAISGESTPRVRGIGAEVSAGGLVREGFITIETTRVGAQSSLARILRAVEEAQSGKTRLQRIADRVAGVFVPVAVVLAILTFFANTLLAGHAWSIGLERAIAVLVIACPCAMGLATPTAVVVATGSAATRGILVRDAATLEAAGQIDDIIFDKTGTLTTAAPEVKDIRVLGEAQSAFSIKEIVALAAALEQHSQHPYARAIVQAAREHQVTIPTPAEFQPVTGKGVAGVVSGRRIVVGSASLLRGQGIPPPESTDANVWVAVDGMPVAGFTLADAIRPSARVAIAELRKLGVRCTMLSGDQPATVRAVADELGIEDAGAELAPEEKLAEIQRLRETGRRVAFVGDGVNDGPALAAADVGISFATATDVAIGAAPITLLGDDLRRVPESIQLARRGVRIIRQNLVWAFVYNVAAIPLAAFGTVSPGWAAAMMMVSSISVVLNSLRLRRAGGTRPAL